MSNMRVLCGYMLAALYVRHINTEEEAVHQRMAGFMELNKLDALICIK